MPAKKFPWFRMYVDFLEDPKIISLAFEDQRHFVGVLALKSGGVIDQECHPEMMDRIVSQKLWVDYAAIRDVKRRLVEAKLITNDWQPLGWERRQFASDSSSDRVRRYRDRQVAESVAVGFGHHSRESSNRVATSNIEPPSTADCARVDGLVIAPNEQTQQDFTNFSSAHYETEMKRYSNGVDTDTDTDTDTETKVASRPSGMAKDEDCANHRKTPSYPPEFEEAWGLYPTRPGNSKSGAYKAWCARLRAGAKAADMVDGVRRYSDYCASERTEPRFIKQAKTFFGPDEYFLLGWVHKSTQSDRHRAHYDRTADNQTMQRQIEILGVKPHDGPF